MKISIGENVKLLRSEKQVTQEQLADYLKISCQAVSKWENGVTTPDIALLPIIAEYFDITIDELFKVDMTGYKNRAERLTARYDMTGRKEDFDKAEAEYERLVSSDNADACDISGYARLNIYRADALAAKAESLLNEAISLGDNGAENLLITLLAKQGRNHESIEKYEAQIKSDSANIKNWHNLVHAYYPVGRNLNTHGNTELALETALRGLEKFPNDAFLHSLCGFVLREQGEHEKALDCWEKSILLDPSVVDNYYATAHTLQELGRINEAIITWEKLLAFYEKSGCLEHTARPARAIRTLVKAAAINEEKKVNVEII
ncbi:MAG: helix-turn-helix domain-containing protein [Defluviitaleaceae bacterium]|nr:helix-turn-helix domain-containing protein [Defluviitaleaceae bacterium]MCL2262930.1 helix-turn-helix domain-containing protein [Defluviitaleaceae bacterium]